MTGIPEGFDLHFRKSPLTDPWEPLYSRRTPEAVILGLRLDRPHTNARGFAHGGLISALADNAMGLSCGAHLRTPAAGLVTVSLNVDFMGRGEIGQWLEFRTSFVKAGRSLCFAQCFVTADDKPIARASASFHVLPATG
ncbi:MAG TPA: PaaI family thioesterase [Rhizomicrobium sp.]|nr:PaaI family thioesterase [Rhizomicrobium sp.]